jgi:hypothetical protein
MTRGNALICRIAMVCGLAGALPASASGATLPGLLTGEPGKVFVVRPPEVAYTGDSTGFLGGFDGNGRYRHDGHLKWSRWTATEALGTGAVWLDNCLPDCAQGKPSPYAVAVRAFDRQGNHYGRLTLRYRYEHKPVVDRRYIVKVGSSYEYSLAAAGA